MHTPAKTFTQRHGNPHTLLVFLTHPYFSISEANGSRRLYCVSFLYSLGGIIIIFIVVAEEDVDFLYYKVLLLNLLIFFVAVSDENKLLVFVFFLLKVENCSRSYAQTGEDGFQCKGLLLVCGRVLKRTRLQYGEEVGLGGTSNFLPLPTHVMHPCLVVCRGGVLSSTKQKDKWHLPKEKKNSRGALWTSA